MKRFWFKFKIAINDSPPPGILTGVGVTAYDYYDAMNIVKQFIFKSNNIPEVTEFQENVDIQTLDADHILPNMGDASVRGIWFPQGYSINS